MRPEQPGVAYPPAQVARRRSPFLGAVPLIALASPGLLILSLVLYSVASGVSLQVWALLALLVIPPIAYLLNSWQTFDLLHPFVVLPTVFGLQNGVNAIYRVGLADTGIDMIATYLDVGLGALYCGLVIGLRSSPAPRQPVDVERVKRVLPWVGLAGLAIGAIYLARSGGPAFLHSSFNSSRFETSRDAGNSLLWLGRTPLVVTALMASVVARDRERRSLGVVLALGAWTTFFFLGTGWRLDLIGLGVFLIVVLRQAVGLTNWKTAILLSMLPIYYFGFGLYRLLAEGGGGAIWLQQTTNSRWELIMAFITSQTGDVNYALINILSTFPGSVGWFYGRSVMVDLATLAPGFQPLFDDYLKGYFGLGFAGGLNPGVIGELYMNGGVVAIVIGMLACGVAIAYSYRRSVIVPAPVHTVQYAIGIYALIIAVAGGSNGLIMLVNYAAVNRVLSWISGSRDKLSVAEWALLSIVLIAVVMEMLRPAFWAVPGFTYLSL